MKPRKNKDGVEEKESDIIESRMPYPSLEMQIVTAMMRSPSNRRLFNSTRDNTNQKMKMADISTSTGCINKPRAPASSA